jgi:hypothetical protein
MTCKYCKHWDRTDWHNCAWGGHLGSCQRLTDGDGEEMRNRIRVYDDSIPATTEENFGCIHYKPPTSKLERGLP